MTCCSRVLIVILSILMLTAFSACQTPKKRKAEERRAAIEDAVTGQVSYRERIALPPGAMVTIRLHDVTDSVLIAEQGLDDPGQVPITFRVEYDSTLIQPRHTYQLSGEIRVNGELWFQSTDVYEVITGGSPQHVVLGLRSVDR